MRGFAYPMALLLLPAVRGSKNERGTRERVLSIA
jgi:hypothetical protein